MESSLRRIEWNRELKAFSHSLARKHLCFRRLGRAGVKKAVGTRGAKHYLSASRRLWRTDRRMGARIDRAGERINICIRLECTTYMYENLGQRQPNLRLGDWNGPSPPRFRFGRKIEMIVNLLRYIFPLLALWTGSLYKPLAAEPISGTNRSDRRCQVGLVNRDRGDGAEQGRGEVTQIFRDRCI